MVTLLLGVVAGIIGVVETVINIVSKGGTHPGFNIFTLIVLIFSIVGTIGALLTRQRPKLGGWLMVLAAVIGFALVNISYLPPGVLLLLAGFMGIFTKPAPTDEHQR